MKSAVFALGLLCSSSLGYAQSNPIDRYLTHKVESQVVARTQDGLNMPQDLDFCRVAGRENELWVLNRGDDNGGSIVILYDAGKETQHMEYRHDSHAAHFMRFSTAIAMAPNGNFGTVQEILNTLSDPVITFMGPTLWNSDTSIFARVNQNDWVDGELLGSHSDMLHQSPFSMGISADTANVYWVFDGYHGQIFRYDFAMPHPYGHDNHSDGIVYRYPIEVLRIPDLPSHMVLDEETKWLYVVDNGNNRVLRLATRSGTLGKNLEPEYEPLHIYREVDNPVWEELAVDIPDLCGVDVFDGRMIVTNNRTGEMLVYDITATKPAYMGSIMTGDAGMMGVKVGPDSLIWYVNKEKNTLVRLTPGEPLASLPGGEVVKNEVYPNPASSTVHFRHDNSVREIEVLDVLGRVVRRIENPDVASFSVSDLTNGVYYIRFVSSDHSEIARFVVER